MNEIIRIHLAGVPYEIDVAAKKKLEKYLDAIRESLGRESAAIEDIEIRITEILAERRVMRDGVIKEADVAAVKAQLGEPADYASEEKSGKKKSGDEESWSEKVGREFSDRKYFRDTKNGVVGGVLAGLSAYTKFDVTLLRVLYVLLVIFTGLFPFVILYVVVWICAPEARTASERLEMRGEPVNLESLKKSAEDVGEKASAAAKKVSQRIEADGPQIANTAVRVVMAISGVIGFIIFIPALIALIPATVVAIFVIAAATIPAKALFVATMILACILAFTIISLGISISSALVTAKFGTGAVVGFVVTCIFAIFVTIAACTTGGLWVNQVPRGEIRETLDGLIEDGRIHVRGDDAKIDLGPIHIDTQP